MSADVFFCPFAGDMRQSLPQRLALALLRAGLKEVVAGNPTTAVKVHWGEPGNVTFVQPALIRTVVQAVGRCGGRPFVTDTSTLYAGRRGDALNQLETAAAHGFTHQTLGAPVLVADGLRGNDYRTVPVAGRHLTSVHVAGGIHDAGALVTVSHVKGHMLFGFGGALKNVGMGCVAAADKHRLHVDTKPEVDEARCVGCGLCVRHCPTHAIALSDAGPSSKAHITPESCTGCGECIVHCPEHAIPIRWETQNPPLQEKTAEAAAAALLAKSGRLLFVNVLVDITRDCDCCGWSGLPLVPNIGILVSRDPVAIDQASLDLVDEAPVIAGSDFSRPDIAGRPGRFGALVGCDPTLLLAHAERLGVGQRTYRLRQVHTRDEARP